LNKPNQEMFLECMTEFSKNNYNVHNFMSLILNDLLTIG
jgi:hypothetical protein